jgi:hypothetical protein
VANDRYWLQTVVIDDRYWLQTVVIDVLFSFNLAAILE